jgi:hypothetical protein
VRLAGHENADVRGNAVVGFGHIARINRKLTESRVRLLIEDASRDENDYVRGHAESAADDVELFLRWRVTRSLLLGLFWGAPQGPVPKPFYETVQWCFSRRGSPGLSQV